MNWGLTEGLLGRTRASLAPSVTALGPNTYLTRNDFLRMLGAAFIAHVIIFTIASLLPADEVTNIPVRALSFKLGDADRVAAYGSGSAVSAGQKIAAPALTAAPPSPPIAQAAPPNETWRATAAAPTPAVPAPLKPIAKPVKPPKIYKVADAVPTSPTPQPAAPAAIAPNPQQYIREVGAPSQQAVAAAMAGAATNAGIAAGAVGGQGTETTMTPQTIQTIRARYEQEISLWIQHHKYYPVDAGGREGRAVVRMRIDRAGNVRYYAIEQSAGMVELDAAALEMIRRANPVPVVPANYPAGNLVEFLIPITFKAPQ